MPKQKKRKHVSKSTAISLVLALSVIVFTAVLVNLWIYPYRMQKIRNQRMEYISSVQEKQRNAPPVVLTPKPTMQAYKSGPKIDRTVIDTANWKTYENDSVGFRFKYPQEWGEPKTYFRPGDTGYEFRLFFSSYSSFGAGGNSIDFMLGRGGSIFDFNGFSNKSDFTKEIFCKKDPTIFCQNEINGVHAVFGWAYGPHHTELYSRYYAIDRPGKQIAGLVFGGGFLSPDMQAYVDDLTKTDTLAIKSFDKAVLERRLDAESMKNFDTIEKVFETIELW